MDLLSAKQILFLYKTKPDDTDDSSKLYPCDCIEDANICIMVGFSVWL